MLLALSHTNIQSFDSYLLLVLAFNAVVLFVLAFAPQLHGKITSWLLPRR
jgi:hypothetical protein